MTCCPPVAGLPYNWPFDGDLRPSNTCLIIIDMQARVATGLAARSAAAPAACVLLCLFVNAGGLLQGGRICGQDGLRSVPHPGTHQTHPVSFAARDETCCPTALPAFGTSRLPRPPCADSTLTCLPVWMQVCSGCMPPAGLPRHPHPRGPPPRPLRPSCQ